MGKIKLRLARRSVENKIQFGTDVNNAMSSGGGGSFPNSAPSLSSMNTSKTALQTKSSDYNAAKQVAEQKKTELDSAEADFDRDMTLLANDVEAESNGDEALIQSAGFDVKNPPSPPQIPGQVLNFAVVESANNGTFDMTWKKVKEAKSYNIEMTTDVNAPASWAFKVSTTKTKISVSGLISGTKYFFRVYAVGAAGNGAPSDPAVKYAP